MSSSFPKNHWIHRVIGFLSAVSCLFACLAFRALGDCVLIALFFPWSIISGAGSLEITVCVYFPWLVYVFNTTVSLPLLLLLPLYSVFSLIDNLSPSFCSCFPRAASDSRILPAAQWESLPNADAFPGRIWRTQLCKYRGSKEVCHDVLSTATAISHNHVRLLHSNCCHWFH